MLRRIRTRILVIGLMLGAVGGCMVGPDYQTPQTPTPDAWHAALVDGLDAKKPYEPSAWWRAFNDDELNALIVLAQINNYNLLTAISRIEVARAKYGIASADLWPYLTTDTHAYWTERPDRGPVASEILPNSDYAAALDLSWEIDLWGRVRRSMESADANIQVSIENWRDTLVTLRAEVATTYIACRTFQQQEAILRQNITLQKQTLALVAQQYVTGTVNDLALARAQASLNNSRSRLPAIQTDIAQSINRLSVLIGQAPGPLRDRLSPPHPPDPSHPLPPLPTPPPTLAVGIPADILRQRPDIRAAERRLASKTARIGVATADLLPQLSINGSMGFEADSFDDWFNESSFTAGVGPSIAWPIFTGGQILNNIKITDLQAQQALYAYRQTVLRALEETENAMTAYANTLTTERELGQTVDAYERVVTLATDRYEAGIEDLQDLIDAQQRLLNAQEQLAMTRGQAAANVVNLYKALGGDWAPGSLPPGSLPPESLPPRNQRGVAGTPKSVPPHEGSTPANTTTPTPTTPKEPHLSMQD